MTLRTSALAVFGVTLAVVALVAYGLLSSGLASRFASLEEREARRDLGHAKSALESELGKLDVVVADWAWWDDTYHFVDSVAPGFILTNLADETFSTLQINLLVCVRPDGSVAYAKSMDWARRKRLPLPADLAPVLAANRPIWHLRSPESMQSGLLTLSSGPCLFVSRPILTNEKKGPIRGALLMARYLDVDTVARLARQTELQVSLFPCASRDLPADFAEARRELAGRVELVRKTLNRKTAASYALLRDVRGRPAAILRVATPRLYFLQAQQGLRNLMFAVLAFCLLYGLCGMVVLERCILGPIAAFSAQAERIGDGGDLTARLQERSGNGEWARLGRSLNKMLASLQQAQRRGEETERRHRAIVTQSSEGICLVDCDTRRIVEGNAAFQEMLGFAGRDLTGRSLAEVFPAAGGELASWTQGLTPDRRQQHFELHHRRPDGEERDLEVSVTLLQEEGQNVACGVVRDVTARHRAQAERERLEAQLRQSQKLQAVGQLASGLAHNFNNVLAVIMATLDLILIDCPEAVAERLRLVQASSQKAAAMVNQFMLFGRRAPTARQPLDLRPVVADVVEMCRRTFDRKIQIELERAEHPLTSLGDHSQIHGVALNMCLNARDAIEALDDPARVPQIRVTAGRVTFDGQSACAGNRRAGTYVRLAVSDNGVGMSEETRQRIFEPFFTTKEVGRGTGLGLSTAYGVIAEHEGWIECDSVEGVGTTFAAYLPTAPAETVLPAPGADAAPEPLPEGEVVLFVDDEEDLRELVGSILEHNGYRVKLAAHGREALATFQAEHQQIAAVIVDLSMPHMSGWELMDAMRALDPDARIIICSGYLLDESALRKAQAVVSKPFACSDLLRTLGRVVRTPRPSRETSLRV